MKLTKTQQELIAQARRYGGRYAVEAGSGRGAFGGRVSYGARERAALFALEEKGLIKITRRETFVDYARGNAIHSVMWSFELIG